MASFLVYLFLLSLCTISALASLSPERTSTPTDRHHLRRSRRPAPSLGAPRPRDSGCITHYGVINVTSAERTLNGYLAPPSALKDGAYGLVANNSRDGLKVSYCDGGALFDILALNGPFAESGYPAIGGVQSHLVYNQNPVAPPFAFATLAGMEQGIQGPPRPANHTFHEIGDLQNDAQSTMWTIDSTKTLWPHWEDEYGNPVLVGLGHADYRLRPADGPRFVAMHYLTGLARLDGHVTPVKFVFVPS